MTQSERIHLLGATASPYTRKMVALMRYRHIPYTVNWSPMPGNDLDAMNIEQPKPLLLPIFLLNNKNEQLEAVCDSTPIIRRLETMHPQRTVLPSNPVVAFIDYLLEDFADEWCTKYMFHYRWHPAEDADNAGTLLPFGGSVSLPEDQHQHFKTFFSKRQIDRLYVVGSNDTTAPIIDASYRRFLKALDAHLAQQPFLLGKRPAAADFALYGQLTQLVGVDPTPRAITHELSPRTVAWVALMEDQSGCEADDSHWNTSDQIPSTLRGILNELGRVYAPALLANARAVEAGEKMWEAQIDGATWTQQTFPYQAKCLRWINEQYQALSGPNREKVDTLLGGTGCEAIITPSKAS